MTSMEREKGKVGHSSNGNYSGRIRSQKYNAVLWFDGEGKKQSRSLLKWKLQWQRKCNPMLCFDGEGKKQTQVTPQMEIVVEEKGHTTQAGTRQIPEV